MAIAMWIATGGIVIVGLLAMLVTWIVVSENNFEG